MGEIRITPSVPGAVSGNNEMFYINIIDNEDKERSIIVYSKEDASKMVLSLLPEIMCAPKKSYRYNVNTECSLPVKGVDNENH